MCIFAPRNKNKNVPIMPRKKQPAKAKEPVRLRSKKLANGNQSLYLDYYKEGRREYEYLRLYLVPERTPFDKITNAETLRAANAIKAERVTSIIAEDAGLKKVAQSKILLSDWMRECADRALQKTVEGMNRHTWGRMLEQTGAVLTEYAGARVRLKDIDKEFVKGFIDYLQHGYIITRGCANKGQHLSPKSAHKKYSCFRFALNEAVRDGILHSNPCNLLSSTDKIEVPESTREYLTEEELKALEATPTASAVRSVYLFMCCCGLRISDVKGMRWADIEKDGGRWRLRIRQQKTQTPLYLPLSDAARQYLPAQGDKPADSPVFEGLPTEPAMNRALKRWATAAGITKNLTLHTARHTFATLMLTKGADLYTTSKLLGHREIGTTQIYAKIIDKKKENAVDLLNNLF